MQEPSKVHHLPISLDTPKSVDPPKFPDQSTEAPTTTEPFATAAAASTTTIEDKTKSLDRPSVTHTMDSQEATTPRGVPKTADGPRGPVSSQSAGSANTGFPKTALLLAVCAVGGMLAFATGNLGLPGDQSSLEQKLEGARAMLSATSDELKATQAKLAAEQAKGALAEKALADIKAVLATIPSAAAPANASAPPAVPAKAQPPK